MKLFYGGANFCKLHQRIYINECCGCGLVKISRIRKSDIVLQNVKAYFEKNPKADWKEIHANVENHYANPSSLSSNMSLRGFTIGKRNLLGPEKYENIEEALKEAAEVKKLKGRKAKTVERYVAIAKVLSENHNMRPREISKLLGKERTTIIHYLKHYKQN